MVEDLGKVREAQAELERRLDALAGQGVRPIPAEELEALIMGKRTEGETAPVAFRLDAALLKRLDAHAERMREAMPGLTISRTDALRTLLLKALDAEEKRGKR